MADIRELEKKAADLSEAFQKKVAELEDCSAQVKRRRDALEEEKRMMSSLPLHGDPCKEIIEINVGGQIFQTKRTTQLVAEGSLLAAMFSGRWEESLDRDKEGRAFFDFDPAHFRILLNKLRLCRITEPEKILPPVEQPKHKELFDAMVDFLGMRELLYGQSCGDAAALNCSAAGLQDGSVRVDGQRISGGGDLFRPVVGKALLLSNGGAASATWKVSLTQLPRAGFFAGIICNPTPANSSFSDATSYGWNSSVCCNTAGRWSSSRVAPPLQQGDCAVFKLDVTGKRLRMFIERTGQTHDIPLGDGVAAEARLHLNLHGPGTELVVSPATADEVRRAGF